MVERVEEEAPLFYLWRQSNACMFLDKYTPQCLGVKVESKMKSRLLVTSVLEYMNRIKLAELFANATSKDNKYRFQGNT